MGWLQLVDLSIHCENVFLLLCFPGNFWLPIFALFVAEYFCISINILGLFSGTSETICFYWILLLRFVRQNQSYVQSRVNYSLLMRICLLFPMPLNPEIICVSTIISVFWMFLFFFTLLSFLTHRCWPSTQLKGPPADIWISLSVLLSPLWYSVNSFVLFASR